MNISIYKKLTGEITRTASFPDSDLHLQFDPKTEYFVEGIHADDKFYVDHGVPVPMPPQQSPHHVFNYTTKQWEDPRTLADLKAAQWTAIKQARSAAEYAGFTWDGSTFDSDALSQNRITGAVTLAQMSSSFTIDWILADNTVRTLNQISMLQVGATLGQHVGAVFTNGVLRRAAIDAAVSVEEVEAVVW